MLNPPHVLVIGASGRFLARSAILSRCQVSVIDLFGDVDTRQMCAASNRFSKNEDSVSWTRRINALGDLSVLGKSNAGEILRAFDPEMGSTAFTIVFSGGAENYPEFFRQGFWGPSEVAGPMENSIAALLHWPVLERVCQTHQIRMPRSIQTAVQNIDASTTWLQKRERSGGGLQVRHWPRSNSVELDSGYYLQEKIKGTTVSGCFVSCHNGGRSTTQLLGACQQLPNEEPNDFRYQGSLGPVELDEHDHQEMDRVGRIIASELSLKGVWGIDFISNAQGLYLIDINPRVTASAELIERYYRRSQPDFTILGAHLDATMHGRIPTPIREFGGCVFSKTILYLESDIPLIVDEAMVECFKKNPAITDVPAIGSEILPGHPVVTVHAEAKNPQALEEMAVKRVRELRDKLTTIVCSTGFSPKAAGKS